MTARPSWSTFFTDHPVRPVDVRDPLAAHDPLRMRDDAGTGSGRPRVGFACLWEPVPERTWSYSAWNLRAALRLAAETTDIGVQIPSLSRTALKAIHTRYRSGRLTTSWSYSRLTDAYNMRLIRRELAANPQARRCEAALMIDDLAVLPLPYFVYYDSSWDALIASTESAEAYAASRLITPSNMARRRERQLAVYEQATGIIAMSHWFARSLVEQSGVPPAKVHVVHPGVSSGRVLRSAQADAGERGGSGGPGGSGGRGGSGGSGSARPLPVRAGPRRRLLFVGRQYKEFDFYRKGGDLAVAALAVLRRDYDPAITLSVVGMDRWPLPGSPPDGVRFLGVLPPDDVAALYDDHDLLVVPSRAEPFGIVFVEALSRGLPCVARDAYAMPEIVTPGVSGALISKDDEHELAATIAAVLADDALYEACRARAPQMTAYFSWERAATEILQVITRKIPASR